MILGLIRVSTKKQDLDQQKLAILSYTNNQNIQIDRFIELKTSTNRESFTQIISEALSELQKGDMVVVSEMSRLGRSITQIITTIEDLSNKGIGLIAIKQNLKLQPGEKPDMATKMMITLNAMYAEVERDLIRERTIEGLAQARKKGVKLGRPVGSRSESKLDGKEEMIRDFLQKKVSKASIAKITGVSRTAVHWFIKSRGLENPSSREES